MVVHLMKATLFGRDVSPSNIWRLFIHFINQFKRIYKVERNTVTHLNIPYIAVHVHIRVAPMLNH